jgi:hypothetical protein
MPGQQHDFERVIAAAVLHARHRVSLDSDHLLPECLVLDNGALPDGCDPCADLR